MMTGVCPYHHVPRFAVHSSDSKLQTTATKVGRQTIGKLIVQTLAQLIAQLLLMSLAVGIPRRHLLCYP